MHAFDPPTPDDSNIIVICLHFNVNIEYSALEFGKDVRFNS